MNHKKTIGMFAMIAIAGAASAHEGDIGLAIVDGNIVTGEVIEDSSGEYVQVGERVFGAELELNGSFVTIDEPGLFAETGTFPTGSGLGFNIERAVRLWNETDMHLDEIPDETISIEFGPESRTSPATDTVVGGFSFDVGDGGFDEHYEFFLDAPADPGIYVLELSFWSTDGSIGASDSTWFVFNYDRDEDAHDAAIEWVEDNYVPAPMAALLLGVIPGLTRRRH